MLTPHQDMLYNAFAIFIIFLSVIIIVIGIITIHELPYKIAKSRNHYQKDAIRCMSLMGLVLFPLWLLAMIWAYIRPSEVDLVKLNEDSVDDKVKNTEPPTEKPSPVEEKAKSPNSDAAKPQSSGGKK